MARSILLIIASDPRRSGRPAEAIRMAAGVGAWKKAVFTVLLRGPAVLALSEWADEFVDEDNYVRYLPMLADPDRRVLVELNSPELAEVENPVLPFETVDSSRIAFLAASHDVVLEF